MTLIGSLGRFPCAISAPSHRRAVNNCQFTRIAMRSWIQCIQSKKKHVIGDRGEAELMSLKFESYIVYDVMRSECIRARSVSFANLFFFTFLFCCLLFHLSMWDTYEQHCKPIPELRATAMSWPKKVLHHLRNYNYRLNEVIQLCLYVGDFADYSTWKKETFKCNLRFNKEDRSESGQQQSIENWNLKAQQNSRWPQHQVAISMSTDGCETFNISFHLLPAHWLLAMANWLIPKVC